MKTVTDRIASIDNEPTLLDRSNCLVLTNNDNATFSIFLLYTPNFIDSLVLERLSVYGASPVENASMAMLSA